jgi:K+-sensing histidine kinase KdpD
MELNQTKNFRNSAAQFFLGSIALAFVTLAFFRLHVDLASAAFAYLIVIVLLSLMGSFIASALLAVTSAAGLADFFIPAIVSFRTDNSQHIVVVVAFLVRRFNLPARRQAGGVVIQLGGRQQSHHLKRDEQGE